ncbi:MAG: lycopene cyclase domain-containing protein [Fimbriimonadaceae bacterium]|nr:lycopene cyclase domain-containing protein [Chitinophagales bacterium]
MKFLYLLVDFFTIIVPFVFSFHPKLNFYKNFKPFFISNILIASLFLIWDILFTKLGVWGFNPDYVLGIYLFNLPLEEILFFVCIPFSCLFTYHCLNLFVQIKWKPKTENIFVLSLSTVLFIIGIYFYSKLYTSATFISLSVLLLMLKYFAKVNWLGKLIIIYPVLLIPFFIVNGILTGSGLEQPVVWYNDLENIGIRLFTIPVEDIFYGFELISLNIFLYEYFKTKFNTQSHKYDEQNFY